MQSVQSSAVRQGTYTPLHRIVLCSLTLAGLAFCLAALSTVFLPVPDISSLYLYREDRWLLLAQACLLLAEIYRALIDRQRVMFLIGEKNRARGFEPVGCAGFLTSMVRQSQLGRRYPASA